MGELMRSPPGGLTVLSVPRASARGDSARDGYAPHGQPVSVAKTSCGPAIFRRSDETSGARARARARTRTRARARARARARVSNRDRS